MGFQLANAAKNIDGIGRNTAERIGTDVQKVVYTHAVELLLVCKDLLGCFPVVVVVFEAPCVVQRGRGLIEVIRRILEAEQIVHGLHVPCAFFRDLCRTLCGNLVIAERNVIIHAVAEARVHKAVRLIGRFECSFGENSCCYMAEGDLSISSMMKKKSNSCFPLNHYHGISIVINLDELLPEIRQIMELLNIDLHYIQKYICEGNRCCIMRANPSIEHIFSELYHVREKRKPGYMKVKMLELLLFLSDLNTAEEVLQTDYFNQNQVALIKAVASYITEDLTAHHTIEQLSQKFEISTTALKKCFRGVYGTSVYSYLRTYRLQVAKKLLLETESSVTEIASKIGYENPNKFTSAFKETYGSSPTEFRKSVRLDRSGSVWSGEEI